MIIVIGLWLLNLAISYWKLKYRTYKLSQSFSLLSCVSDILLSLWKGHNTQGQHVTTEKENSIGEMRS